MSYVPSNDRMLDRLAIDRAARVRIEIRQYLDYPPRLTFVLPGFSGERIESVPLFAARLLIDIADCVRVWDDRVESGNLWRELLGTKFPKPPENGGTKKAGFTPPTGPASPGSGRFA